MKIDGVMSLIINHADGTESHIEKHNMIVDGGFDLICGALGNTTRPAILNKVMVGTGTVETTSAMTALEAKLAEVEATYFHNAGTKVFLISGHFAAGSAVGAITEAGVFNSDDTMFDRVTFSTTNISADDEITVNFQFTLS